MREERAMTTAVEFHGVNKVYRSGEMRFLALDDVSFEIAGGESVGIVGKSGSGKSTLLYLAGGIARPSSGRIIINGSPVYRMPESELAIFRRKNIGYVFQNFCLLTNLTALENVMYPLLLSGMSKQVRREKASALLDRLGLSRHMHQYPSQMSGGQQQRIAIARAAIGNPSILLADEPTGNLDTQTAREVMELLRELCIETKATLLAVTHDPENHVFFDRLLQISDGKLTFPKDRLEEL